ncbi:MAG TPA: hydroxyacid dehydrogenase [Flavobacteriaceae bacterium]|nr:hydroxyacid dehydrogenase [Flavobacteriaceae bacterium]
MAGKQIMKVLNAEPLNYSKKAILLWKKKGLEYIETSWDDIEKKIIFKDVLILIIRLNRYVDKVILDKFPNLKFLISATTGHDHIDLEYLKLIDVNLISLRGEDKFLKTIPSTAEHTWALLLALIRKIPQANEHVKSGNWNRDLFKGFQLKDKTLGIIGLGRTGLKVAKYAKVFDMEVKYFDPFVENTDFFKCKNLQELLAISDVITIHIHLNEYTINYINKKNVNFIKKGALLINTSRGNIWNEEALVRVLKNKQISGIAVDVLSTELENIKRSPLWEAQQSEENIIITPHIGGATYDAMWACEEFIISLIN